MLVSTVSAVIRAAGLVSCQHNPEPRGPTGTRGTTWHLKQKLKKSIKNVRVLYGENFHAMCCVVKIKCAYSISPPAFDLLQWLNDAFKPTISVDVITLENENQFLLLNNVCWQWNKYFSAFMCGLSDLLLRYWCQESGSYWKSLFLWMRYYRYVYLCGCIWCMSIPQNLLLAIACTKS